MKEPSGWSRSKSCSLTGKDERDCARNPNHKATAVYWDWDGGSRKRLLPKGSLQLVLGNDRWYGKLNFNDSKLELCLRLRSQAGALERENGDSQKPLTRPSATLSRRARVCLTLTEKGEVSLVADCSGICCLGYCSVFLAFGMAVMFGRQVPLLLLNRKRKKLRVGEAGGSFFHTGVCRI